MNRQQTQWKTKLFTIILSNKCFLHAASSSQEVLVRLFVLKNQNNSVFGRLSVSDVVRHLLASGRRQKNVFTAVYNIFTYGCRFSYKMHQKWQHVLSKILQFWRFQENLPQMIIQKNYFDWFKATFCTASNATKNRLQNTKKDCKRSLLRISNISDGHNHYSSSPLRNLSCIQSSTRRHILSKSSAVK